MYLANPYFIENIYQDQPYSSMLLIAPKCDFTCVGCQNIHLKGDFKDFKLEYLIAEYIKNPFFEGITVGGLEIFLSGDDFLEDLLNLVKKTKTKNLTIYTRFLLEDIFVKDYIDKLIKVESLKNLYLKTGKYMEKIPKKTVQLDNWICEIGSSNQSFKKIK